MWDKVGIIRNGEGLIEAEERLSEWSYILDKTFLTRRELELRNMVQAASLITEAAIRRQGSVGAHFRTDFPGKGRDCLRHISLQRP